MLFFWEGERLGEVRGGLALERGCGQDLFPVPTTWTSPEMRTGQRAVVLYFIDRVRVVPSLPRAPHGALVGGKGWVRWTGVDSGPSVF